MNGKTFVSFIIIKPQFSYEQEEYRQVILFF